jgi:hypothetical protein
MSKCHVLLTNHVVVVSVLAQKSRAWQNRAAFHTTCARQDGHRPHCTHPTTHHIATMALGPSEILAKTKTTYVEASTRSRLLYQTSAPSPMPKSYYTHTSTHMQHTIRHIAISETSEGQVKAG